jgi:hypothetical protein
MLRGDGDGMMPLLLMLVLFFDIDILRIKRRARTMLVGIRPNELQA